MSKKPFREYLYSDILNDEILLQQYMRVQKLYVKKIFEDVAPVLDDALLSLLRYADILSLSDNEKHQNISQQIAILMSHIFPNSVEVQIVKETVYKNVSNFANLKLVQESSLASESDFGFMNELVFLARKEFNRAIDGEDIFLFDSQKELIDEIRNNQFFSFSAPTSMGKTFVIQNYIKNKLLEGARENFAIIVPTRALLTEIASKSIFEFKDLLSSSNYNIIQSTEAIKDERNFIAILTPERLYYSFLKKPKISFDQIFIDEAHKISGRDRRGILYYKILDIIRSSMANTRVYFSAPVIFNPDIYLELTNFYHADKTNGRAFLFSPVMQNKIYVELAEKRVKIHNNLENKLIDCDVNAVFQDKLNALFELGKGKCNLIYVSSVNKAVEYANDFLSKFGQSIYVSPEDAIVLNRVAKKIEGIIHKEYFLAKLIRKGIAYHIGSLPAQIRFLLENLIRKKLIKFCFCTSTLLDGVNVPVDNLFIYSQKKGLSYMSEVDALNLMGRAGRVTLSEMGNVFFLDEGSDKDKYKNFFNKVLLNPPPVQKLLPQEAIKPIQKKYIISRLLQGKTNLIEKDQKYENVVGFSRTTYEYATSCLNILLHDICNKNESYIVKSFRKDDILTAQDIIEIRKQFSDIEDDDNDITVSVLQKKVLHDAVRNTDIDYPVSFDYWDCVNFLKKLSGIFRWEIYEKETLGRGNSIYYYAVLLLQWMQGSGLHKVIWSAINHHDEKKLRVEYPPRNYAPFNGSLEHKNVIINNTLGDIEQVITYRLSMYFLRFSEAVIKIRGKEALKNDWYDYIEYGTDDSQVIFLQKHGFSRENALDLLTNYGQYFEADSGVIRMNDDILNISDEQLAHELLAVSINFPEIFFKEEVE